MRFERCITSLILMVLLLSAGCAKNTVIKEKDNYTFKIEDLKNMDNILSNQKYLYSTSVNKKYIAVITYKSEDAEVKQYLVSRDKEIDLNISKDSSLVISLPANQTIAYTWNAKNDINREIIKFKNRSLIDVTSPKPPKDSTGISYARQNFYFSTLKSGSEKLVMRYEHKTEWREDSFQIQFNIKVE